MTDTIYVRVAVSPCEYCPIAALSEQMALEEVRVDPVDDRVAFVAADVPTDPPNELEFVEFAGEAFGRYDLPQGTVTAESDVTATAEDDTCNDRVCGSLSAAFANFPVLPRETRVDDSELLVSFVLAGHEELKAIADGFESAGLRIELRRLLVDQDTGDDCADVVPIDLGGVTDRQAEIAAAAVEKGYFDPDGPTAEEIATDLGLAKSTVSEHLRLVTATLFSQLFADDDHI